MLCGSNESIFNTVELSVKLKSEPVSQSFLPWFSISIMYSNILRPPLFTDSVQRSSTVVEVTEATETYNGGDGTAGGTVKKKWCILYNNILYYIPVVIYAAPISNIIGWAVLEITSNWTLHSYLPEWEEWLKFNIYKLPFPYKVMST